MLEDVKHEQLLMLTFSRAAATEFKQRLMELIGNAAHFVEIKTFHSYCLDLVGRIGDAETVDGVVAKAAEMIENGEVEQSRIGKTVLVIDEAQDMNAESCRLVTALMRANEDMRVIAVGDDDQCIFEFAGADPKYMQQLTNEPEARFVELIDNFRSARHIVQAANSFVKNISGRLKITPICPVTDADGFVKLTHHRSENMYQPIVDEIVNGNRQGSSCVLTQTNDEAVIITALLHRHGINAKFVQTTGDIRFCNIAEVRYFVKKLKAKYKSPIIDDIDWEDSKSKTYTKYAASTTLPYLRNCLETFEKTNRAKYYSDFSDFIFESRAEDFCDISDAKVVVSTIHKAKGREFDNVYLMVGGNKSVSQEWLRCYYVAITRAKQYLSIHTTRSVFDGMPFDLRTNCKVAYYMPNEIVLQMTHKDVRLAYFEHFRDEVAGMKGGDMLRYNANALYSVMTGKCLAELSTAMQKILNGWIGKDYRVSKAEVRFVVAWKPKNAPKGVIETPVLLVDLTLNR